MLLTLAPKSWSRAKLASEFNTSERQAQKAQDLVKKNGILALPESKKGKSLLQETKELVIDFYNNDENSRMLPGKKDYVSVKINGKREHVQKRLVLCNLSELYALFKEKYPDAKVGLSKFSELRPRNCILAGASGTHTVCVCVYHENVKLMLNAIDVKRITSESDFPIAHYEDAIKMTVCESTTDDCFWGICEDCPGPEALQSFLNDVLEEHCIERVTYQVWQQTDRSTLHTEVAEADDFVEQLCSHLMLLKPHSYVAKKQSSFYNHLKENLLNGEILITCDFAENYAFVAQNAAQSFHWNNNQATIFTVVVYYRKNGELRHDSIAIISDNLAHDTVAVYEYQKIVIAFLKINHEPKKLYYFTDGASQHFKNKYNFSNLLHHQKDFGLLAEWHFHATSHGKGPCDGIGGNLKRLAARASLQKSSDDQILTPHALFKWAENNLPKTTCFFSSKLDHEVTAKILKTRFEGAKTFAGTKKFHAVIPKDSNLEFKTFSSSTISKTFLNKKGVKKPKNVATIQKQK